ncbi:MAG: WYL domain-containing protein, partial [Epsilonproteobacteria bacterium]|nr:WYL domain-containing protein [Campylobacterota bacterium]
KTLEKAIHYRRHCTIEQNEPQGVKKYELRPYKILFMNENFYLVGENLDENYPFSILRLSNIVSATFNEKQFHHNQNMVNFIKQIQTPFPKYSPNFQENMIKVLVEVGPNKARLFKAKKHLQSQKIEQELEDGTIILSFTVTQEKEMEELIKKWIPYMKVLEPASLKQSIENELKVYLGLL